VDSSILIFVLLSIIGIVKLSRKFNKETIDIKFDCQDEEEADVDMEDIENEQEGEDEPAVGYGIQFEVIVSNGGHKTEFACVAGDTLQIRNVRYIPDGKSVDDLDVYGGPRFEDLDEEVKEMFYDYLAARKIDDDLSHFVLAYSAKKEQAEYENWLSKLSEFTADK
jgi:complement component 1 Q subcomponent-binding protein